MRRLSGEAREHSVIVVHGPWQNKPAEELPPILSPNINLDLDGMPIETAKLHNFYIWHA